MAQSAIPAAIAARDPAAMRAAIVGELVPVIPSNVDPQTWDPRELGTSGGNVWKAVIWQERIWYRDDTSVADHDELTVIALLDGGRYLTNDVQFPGSVKSRAVTTPPDPLDADPGARPAYGEAWRVPAGASGAWSAHEDDVAMWSARGWQYKPAAIGDLHYVEDESVFEHFSAAAEWGGGVPFGVTASTIPASALIWDGRVQNQTTNTPPSAAQGVAYIIGSSPTGAWAGNAGKIAIRESAGTNSTYVIYTPKVGQTVYDIALNTVFQWTGTAWKALFSGYSEVISAFTATNNTLSGSGAQSNGAGYAPNVAMTTTGANAGVSSVLETLTAAVTADFAGQTVEVEYQASIYNPTLSAIRISGGSSSYTRAQLIAAVYVDNETSARDWVLVYDDKSAGTGTIDWSAAMALLTKVSAKFSLTLGDTDPHTIKIRFHIYTGYAASFTTATAIDVARRSLIVRKRR